MRVGSGVVWTWPVIARIWRTVDVERTVANLGLPAEPVADDDLIGGRGVVVRPGDDVPVVILEPTTEGRLAAALARDGEGDAGAYVAPPGGFAEARRVGQRLVAEGDGPFGRSALVALGAEHRRSTFIVIVDTPPATIGR